MTSPAGPLARSLRNVYRSYLDALTDDHAAWVFARDWPVNTRSLAAAIRRVGSPVWWADRLPLGAADDTPFVIASIDEATGMVRFDIADAVDIADLPSAERLDCEGKSMA
jgi:hypothetical protein